MPVKCWATPCGTGVFHHWPVSDQNPVFQLLVVQLRCTKPALYLIASHVLTRSESMDAACLVSWSTFTNLFVFRFDRKMMLSNKRIHYPDPFRSLEGEGRLTPLPSVCSDPSPTAKDFPCSQTPTPPPLTSPQKRLISQTWRLILGGRLNFRRPCQRGSSSFASDD